MLKPLLPLLCLVVGIAQAQELVKDINAVQGGQIDSTDFSQLCIPCGSFIYFPAKDKEHGLELWRTDGTSAGTIRLTDINPGPQDGVNQNLKFSSSSTCLNGNFYYGDVSLTRTDGTPEGTVTAINMSAYELVVFDNKLAYYRGASVFLATGDLSDETLLKTFDPVPGAQGAIVSTMKASGNKLFVEVANGMFPNPDINEIWAFEAGVGTATMVYSTDQTIDHRATMNGNYFFRGYDPDNGHEPWVSDGTEAGTTLLVDTNPGPTDSDLSDWMFVVDDKLVFGAHAPTRTTYISSGTPATTTIVANDFSPNSLRKFHDKVYMSGFSTTSQIIARTDLDFTNFEIVTPSAGTMLGGLLSVAGDMIIYAYEDPTNGVELYNVDEASGSLLLVKDINTGNGSSSPRSFAELGSSSIFIANDVDHGFEFWTTDGTDAGTTILQDIMLGTEDPLITDIYQYNKKLFFLARDAGGTKRKMWTSDGTEAGTRVLYNPVGTTRGTMIAANQFVIMDDNSGFVKVDTDTEDVTDLNFPPGVSNMIETSVQPWLTIGNTSFFNTGAGSVAGHPIGGVELWSADLTTNDISFVKDINPGEMYSSIVYAVRPKGTDLGVTLNDKIIFPARSPEGVEPWVSDGTDGGTMLLKDIAAVDSNYPTNFTVMGDYVYFLAKSQDEGREIWVTDGTPEGTHILKDIAPGPTDGIIDANLTVYNGILLFSATTTGTAPNSLWMSDGTEEGTVPFDLLPNGWANVTNVISSGNYFFFSAIHAQHGKELWISDGSPLGTVLLELEPGPAGSSAGNFVNDNGTLYFTSNGKIYKTQGDLMSTAVLGEAEIASDLFLTDNYLCFLVDSQDYGKELFRIDLSAPVGQVIVFTGFTDIQPGQQYDISVDASSGLPVTLDSSDPSVIEVSGSTIIVHKAGSVTFTATQTGDANFNPATATLDVTVDLIGQTITFQEIPAKLVTDGPFLVQASTDSPLPLTFESSDVSIAEISAAGEITIKKSGMVTITARQEGDGSYSAAEPVSKTLTISKLAQSITLNEIPLKHVGDTPFMVEASTNSGLPLMFSSTDVSIAEISATGEITIKRSGEVMINVNQPGDDIYAAAGQASTSLTIIKKDQSITFDDIPTKTFGNAPFALSGSSNSGLDLLFSSPSEHISINGANVTMNAAGRVTITASQPGNDTYNAAESVSKTFCINPKKPTVTMTAVGADITLTSSETNNVWQRNNVTIPFTGKSFKPTQDGVYKAAGIADDCQGEFSEAVNVVIVGLEDEITDFEVFPNPAQDNIVIRCQPQSHVRILDMTGKEQINETIPVSESVIDISSFAAGMYFIVVKDGTQTRHSKFLKR